jgi:uncharacterized membrane protein
MRPLRTLSWGLLLAMVALAAATYGGLPDRIPVHINFNGEADRFAAKSIVRWFLLPGVALGMLTLLDFIGSRMPAQPDLLNIGDKELLLKLPPRFQAPVMREAQRMMDATACGVMLLMLTVQWEFTRVAVGQRGLGPIVMLISPFVLVFVLLAYVLRISNALDESGKAWKSEGSPAA